jgi:sugar lactone lactonase YvrE
LNDVAIAPGGAAVLMTDMGDLAAMNAPTGGMWPLDSQEAKNLKPLGRVYRVTMAGKVSIEVDHAVEMPDPNGIDVLDEKTYLVADFFRGDLLERKGSSWRVVSPDHRTADGIAHDHSGNIYLSEVRTGKVWSIRLSTGEKQLLATLPSAADLYLDETHQQLIIPDSKLGELVFIPLPTVK